MITTPMTPNPAVTQISGEMPAPKRSAGRRPAPFAPRARSAMRRSCLLGGAGASVLLVKREFSWVRLMGRPFRGQPDAWTREP